MRFNLLSVSLLFLSFLVAPLVAQSVTHNSAPKNSIEARVLSPEVLKNAREELARNSSVGFHKLDSGLTAHLEGTNRNVLVIVQPQKMGKGLADEMIRGFDGDPATNFWNGLRLFDYKELVLSGNGYELVFRRADFVSRGKNFEVYKKTFLNAAASRKRQ